VPAKQSREFGRRSAGGSAVRIRARVESWNPSMTSLRSGSSIPRATVANVFYSV
jgi:hypothetical protein